MGKDNGKATTYLNHLYSFVLENNSLSLVCTILFFSCVVVFILV